MRQKSKGFDFKQFSVQHDRCAMKVGTDAVLLGAWVNPDFAKQILEIGTGCGVIALMLAQRTTESTMIQAIEPDAGAVTQAMENVADSPWADKIAIHKIKLQDFFSDRPFDLIVSNPPYFIKSKLPPMARRSEARHTHSLSHQELIQHVIPLLHPQGRLAVVLPTEEGLHFLNLAKIYGLHVHRQLAFYSRHGKPQERWLLELGFHQTEIEKETLILHADGEDWSEAYRALTREFYTRP